MRSKGKGERKDFRIQLDEIEIVKGQEKEKWIKRENDVHQNSNENYESKNETYIIAITTYLVSLVG